MRWLPTRITYWDYILRHFAHGCHNASLIHKEISEQGYPGAYNNVACAVQYLKKCEREGKPLSDALPGLLATQAKGILITRPEKRTERETLTIERMKKVDPDVQKRCCLFEAFARMFRERNYSTDAARRAKAQATLQGWMEAAKKSGVPELKAFAIKLSQDKKAVFQAIILPYSQGQTKGRVKKPGLIKRSMYGRGKFDLFRQRVLYDSAA